VLTTLWYNAVTTLYVAHNVIYNVLTTSCVAHNVRYNVVTTLYVVTRLFCRLPEALSQRCEWRSNELITTLSQRCVIQLLKWHHNVATTFPQCLVDILVTFSRRFCNVPTTLSNVQFPRRSFNVSVMFWCIFHNVATILLRRLVIVLVMFYLRSYNVI